MPRILVIEHEGDAPAALFGGWLSAAGAELEVCRPWAGEEVPALETADGWVVLGGDMGAYDDHVAPWLPAVRERIAEAAEREVPVLGICLGHQLATVATGGRVEVNPAGERVGLFDIGWCSGAAEDRLVGSLIEQDGRPRGVQWNRDIAVELGPRAEVLAALPDGEIQAARHAPTVWGVQWHPEVDRMIVQSWADTYRADEVGPGTHLERQLAQIDAAEADLARWWSPLAASFVALVRARAGRLGAAG